MYGDVKKLISVRVDETKYTKVMEILEQKNKKCCRWARYTFAEIVEQAMSEYIANNK